MSKMFIVASEQNKSPKIVLTCYNAADIHHAAQLTTITSKLNITRLISTFHLCFVTVYVAQAGLDLIILFSQCKLGLQESSITFLLVVLGMEPRALEMAGKHFSPLCLRKQVVIEIMKLQGNHLPSKQCISAQLKACSCYLNLDCSTVYQNTCTTTYYSKETSRLSTMETKEGRMQEHESFLTNISYFRNKI